MAKEGFFDFRERITGKKSEAEKPSGKADALTVTQLTSQIERALKDSFPKTVHVKGEVSNCNLHRASGHLYFTLKDAGAQIDCVMFRSDVVKLKFAPEDGLEMLVGGRVAVYPQRGRYQLYATSLNPLGRGALELAFQQLCEKLRKEGLFDADRKKPLPKFPKRIVLLTSQSTAALQDMLKVLRRFPWLELMLYHVPVQGDGSAELIADAIRLLNRDASRVGGIDVILLGRGGGSLEDLWEFNEEVVARAMAISTIPIVTGIGHEVDTSVADLVADYHAHTPTEAAQVVTCDWKNARDIMIAAQQRLGRALITGARDARHRLNAVVRHEFFRRPTDRINQLRQRLDDRHRGLQFGVAERLRAGAGRLAILESKLFEFHPRHTLQLKKQHLADLLDRLTISLKSNLKQHSQHLSAAERHLHAISPQSVLQRGYSITTRKKGGAILRSAADAKVGERLLTRFADGEIESTVEDQKQLPLFE